MIIVAILLKFVIISNVYVCESVGKSYQSGEYPSHHLDSIQDQITDNETIKKEMIAKLNDTEAAALAEVMQKEPKFFDEFECKWTEIPKCNNKMFE